MGSIEIFNELGFPIDIKSQPIIYADTWLPLFPGFNDTVYGPDNAFQFYSEISDSNICDFDIDSKRWMEDVAKLFIKEFFEAANSMFYEELKYRQRPGTIRYTHKMIHSIEFQGIYNPTNYYNETDKINVRMQFTFENAINIAKYIYAETDDTHENRKFFERYIEDTFDSRDGFVPRYSKYINSEDWIDFYSCLGDQDKCGHIIECLMRCAGSLKAEEDIVDWEDITEHIEISDYIIQSE